MQDAVKMAQAPLNVKWLERFFALKNIQSNHHWLKYWHPDNCVGLLVFHKNKKDKYIYIYITVWKSWKAL